MSTLDHSLHLRVDLVDNNPQVTLADKTAADLSVDIPKPKRKKRKKTKAIEIPRGSLKVKIYPTKNGEYLSHTLVYYEAGRRRREVRASLQDAKDLAETVLTRLENGEVMRQGFGPQDQASYARALELLAPIGQPLELAVAKYADLVQKLPQGVTQDDLLKFFLENRPKDCQQLPLDKLITQFLGDKKAEISTKWYRSLECHLERFGEYFAKHCGEGQQAAPLHQLTSADLNAFLRDLNVGGRSRHNYRAAIDQLARWSQANGHLPATWSEMKGVSDPGAKPGEIKILTPEQMTRLLAARQCMEEMGRAKRGFVPVLALMGFAGVRHEELNPELVEGQTKKLPLDWRDVHLEERHIYVQKGTDKTGRDRVVPISDNLAAWLLPYVKPNGKICEMANSAHALCDAKKAAGLPSGKNETRNTLRKSFISYRLATTKNISQVAEEAGNSPEKIRSNYKRPIPEKEGLRWFNIWPTAADVVQLNFGFK